MLEVEAQSCGEAPASQRIVGFVVEGAASRRHTEIAPQKELVAARSVLQPPAVAVALVVFVGVFENQLLDARLFEVHRGVHRAVAVESECPQQPAVGFVPARTEDEVLGHAMLGTGLPEREIREGQEILIEDHLVVGILVARDGGDGETAGVVADRESVAQGGAAVGAGVVVADFPAADDGASVVADDVVADIGIGIAALFEHRERKRIVDAESRAVAPLGFPASAAQPFPVAFVARGEILEESARVGIITRYGHAQIGREFVVGRGAELVAVAAAVFGAQAHALVRERREGVDVDYAAHRIAAVERALRSAEYFDAFGVGQFRVVIVLVENRYVVDIESHDRLVDARTESPDVDRRGHARAVVGGEEVGDLLGEVFQCADALPFDGAAADNRRRDGLRPQDHALLDGRHLHLVHHDHGIRRGRFLPGRASDCRRCRGMPFRCLFSSGRREERKECQKRYGQLSEVHGKAFDSDAK